MPDTCICRGDRADSEPHTPQAPNIDATAIATFLLRAALVFPSPANASFRLSNKERTIKHINVVSGESRSRTLYQCELERRQGGVLVLGKWADTASGAEKSVERVLEVLEVGYQGKVPVKAGELEAFLGSCSVCGKV